MTFAKFLTTGLIVSAGALTCSAAQADTDRAGRWFVDLSAGTSLFDYDERDMRDELPDNVLAFFEENEFDDDDSDILNVNVGVGYYLSDDLAIAGRYTSGINYGFLSGLFNDESYDIDVEMFEIDATYSGFHLTDSIDAYVTAALVYNRIDAQVREVRRDDQEQVLAAFDDDEINFKAGAGLLWQFADNWAVKGGYEHYNYLSLSKWHITWQYQF